MDLKNITFSNIFIHLLLLAKEFSGLTLTFPNPLFKTNNNFSSNLSNLTRNVSFALVSGLIIFFFKTPFNEFATLQIVQHFPLPEKKRRKNTIYKCLLPHALRKSHVAFSLGEGLVNSNPHSFLPNFKYHLLTALHSSRQERMLKPYILLN